MFWIRFAPEQFASRIPCLIRAGASVTAANLVLGTAQLGMRYGIANIGGEPDQAHAFAILAAALEVGVGGIDAAPDYGYAEAWLGSFMQQQHCGWRVGTKLPELPRSLSTKELTRHVDQCLTESLRRLRRERIDQYLIHQSADLEHYGDQLIDTLTAQMDSGRIAQIGVSIYSPEDLEAIARWQQLAVVQHPLNLLDRRMLDQQSVSSSRQTEARSVMLQGLLQLGPDDAAVKRVGAGAALTDLRRILATFNYEPVDIALAWVLRAGIDRAVIGVDNVAQLNSLVESTSNELPHELIAAIEKLPAAPLHVIDPRQWSV